jgi:hypothetical protein
MRLVPISRVVVDILLGIATPMRRGAALRQPQFSPSLVSGLRQANRPTVQTQLLLATTVMPAFTALRLPDPAGANVSRN